MNQMMMILLVLILASFAGCSSPPSGKPDPQAPTRTRSARLTPYLSPTASATPSPIVQSSTATPIPSPTPTPRTHEVQRGEDLFGIAMRYGVSLDQIKTANPTVNPQFLSIGTLLSIPGGGGPTPTLAPQEISAITPTPAPVQAEEPTCLPSSEGGAWCFYLVSNPYEFPLENLSALIHLVDPETQAILTKTAFLPLDTLAPGARLPLLAYYAPPLSAPLQASAEILTSLPQTVDDGRYLAVRVENLETVLEEGGRSVAVTLDVLLVEPSTAAGRVRVVAVAYDASDQVIGARRWENEDSLTLAGGEALSITMRVYPVAGLVNHVEVFAEARP